MATTPVLELQNPQQKRTIPGVAPEDNKQLFYDYYSKRYFESTMEDVLKAQNEANKILATSWGISLNELYNLFDLPGRPEYEELGWTTIMMEDMYWHAWLEFDHKKVVLDDGLECTIIAMPLEPIIDYLEY